MQREIQQAAAAGVVTAIRVTMPEHGKLYKFSRALQIDPEGELSVSFRAAGGEAARALNAIWPCLLLFLVVWGGLGLRRPRRGGVAA